MKTDPNKPDDYIAPSVEPMQNHVADPLSIISSDFLRPKDLASALGVSIRTLTRWHAMREGPPRIRRGRQIFYRKTAVVAWLKSAEVATKRNSKPSG